MAERIQDGVYSVGMKSSSRRRRPDPEVGVAKGEAINNDTGMFKGHGFLSKTKWYVWERREYLAEYPESRGTFALDEVRLVGEYDSKKKAIRSI